MDVSALLVHSASNLTQVWQWMHFNKAAESATELRRVLPPQQYVNRLLQPLRRASCAVVGASSMLRGCQEIHSLCKHDVIIQVNDHPAVFKFCRRVDFQFVNAHSCYWEKEMHWFKKWFNDGNFLTFSRACRVHPRVARIRHEWNPRMVERFAHGTLLSSGLVTQDANRRIGKCCASAGGVAIAFALRACKSVIAYGVGGVNRTHFDNPRHAIDKV